jgi:hypothetical protein
MNLDKLSKHAIKKLLEAPIRVALWNGSFKRAKVVAEMSKYMVEVSADVSHPMLEWASKKRDAVSVTIWKGCNGYAIPLPQELYSLVEDLRKAATMTDDEAVLLDKEMREALRCFADEMGLR